MTEYLMQEVETLHRQGVEEIVAELQIVESDLVEALVQMRPIASHALREHIQKLVGEEERNEMGQLNPPQPRVMFLRQLALRVAAVALILLVVLFLLLATVPEARAAFGRFVQQRFGLVLVDPSPEAEPTEEAELPEGETLTEVAIPPIRLEEAQAQVDFPIPLPLILPEGFELWSARVGTGPGGESVDEDGNRIVIEPPVQVILAFKPDESNQPLYDPDATLSLDIFDTTDLQGGRAVPTGSEESTEVGGNPAVFVKGTWMKIDDSQPPSHDNIVWDETADSGMLSWEANGFTFVLQGSHLKFTLEDYIRIAESIR